MKILLLNKDNISWYFDTFLRRIDVIFSSTLSKWSLSWWRVIYGVNLTTRGLLIIKRIPKSTIVIGNNCRFNNRPTSNHIGINRPCIISTQMENASIIIGDNCGLSGTVIGCFKSIILGNNVMCGANTLITDSDWHPTDPRSGSPKPIIIEDNVWLGVNVTILKGVKIGANSVIGAGSIVTKDIPSNVIAAGNPCKVIQALTNLNKTEY
ncbi:MAG: DapH/DapD/GlmU-related protein [Bacteroidetes bacterium]|nr:DapH/DapD/GlmU-related protein [Bacteroidota bacterium]